MTFLLFLAAMAMAETYNPSVEVYDNFDCGLITQYSPNRINKNCLTEATNVQVDEDFAITRPKGYSQFNLTTCAGGQSIKGLWHFLTSDATDYIVIHSSNSMFYDDGSGECNAITGLTNVLVTTATVNCVQTLGRLWCTSKEYGGFSWNRTSTEAITGMPRAGQIGAMRNRVIVGDIQGEESRVRGSGELDGTDWTVQIPGRSTTPFNLSFGGIADGKRVVALMGEYQNAYIVGKADSIWGISGYDRRDFSTFRISEEIGIKDSRIVREKNNALYWMSGRGIEKMMGTRIERISDGIRNTIEEIINAPATQVNTITQTTQSDWELGNLQASGPGAKMSATISPGDVVVSTWQVIDTLGGDFASGTQVNTSTLPVSGSLVYIQGSSAAFVNAGGESNNVTTNWSVTANAWYATSILPCSGTYSFTDETAATRVDFYIKNENNDTILYSRPFTITDNCANNRYSVDTSTFTNHKIRIELISSQDSSRKMISVPFVRGSSLSFWLSRSVIAAPQFDMDESLEVLASTFTSQIFDTSFSSPVGGPFTVGFSSSSDSRVFFRVQASTASDGGGFETVVDQSLTAKNQSDDRRYWRYLAYFNNSSSTNSSIAQINDVTLNAGTTGYFIGNCFDVSAASVRLGSFFADIATNGGSVSLFVSSAATCALSTATTQNWVAQSNNQPLNLTTAAFIGARALFSIGSSSDTPSLQKWYLTYENDLRNPLASAVYKDRYYIFFSTTDSTNDHAIEVNRMDKITLLEDTNVASALVYKGNLYTGDSANSGKIFLNDTGYNHDGGNYRFVFKTNDNDLGNSTSEKIFDILYIELKSEQSLSDNIPLTVTYFIDGSTTSYALGDVNLDEADEIGYFTASLPFPTDQQNRGRWIAFRVSYNGNQGPISLYKMILYYRKVLPF